MRLVEVRDFLAGQSWFDLTQYRLSPPEGVLMHWSRLIDLPLAALIRASEAVVTPAVAERIAVTAWPAVLWLVFLAGVAQFARTLSGNAAACLALIFAAVTAPVLQHFRPGAIDHHNVQLALLICTLALAGQPTIRAAVITGTLSAVSLAIGQEMAPAIAALAACVAVRWIVQGDSAKQATAAFALAFAGVTALLFGATVPPSRYSVSTCDALSLVQLTLACVGGCGLALIAVLPVMTTAGRRIAGAAALGAILTATIVLGFPSCLGDPYAQLDPRLTTLWLAHVSEARSIVALWHDLPQQVAPYYGLPAMALALGTYRCWREKGDARWPWLIAVVVLASLCALALWQVRGCAAANAVAVALAPAALVRGYPALEGRTIFLGLGRAALIIAALINPITLAGFGSGLARAKEIAVDAKPPNIIADGPATCQRAADYTPLAQFQPGLVLAFIDAGPFILLQTPHSVLAAPYHRNLRGNSALLDVFLAAPDEGRMDHFGIDYVAVCPGAPERHTYTRQAPQSLLAALVRGEPPPFLERVPLTGTELAFYRRRR
jgi:hypothetical protein